MALLLFAPTGLQPDAIDVSYECYILTLVPSTLLNSGVKNPFLDTEPMLPESRDLRCVAATFKPFQLPCAPYCPRDPNAFWERRLGGRGLRMHRISSQDPKKQTSCQQEQDPKFSKRRDTKLTSLGNRNMRRVKYAGAPTVHILHCRRSLTPLSATWRQNIGRIHAFKALTVRRR